MKIESIIDRLKEGKNYDELKDKIIYVLKHDENLRRINQEFKGKVLHESKNDKELIEKLFSSLKNNEDIKNLLKNNIGEFAFLDKRAREKEKQKKMKNAVRKKH